jgi:hypothetical protein
VLARRRDRRPQARVVPHPDGEALASPPQPARRGAGVGTPPISTAGG